MIELLAPAGNMEKLKTAINFGANACYFAGKQFGLRAFSDNFDLDGIKEAVDNNGFIGLFQGGFKAAAVGTSAALIFSYLSSLIFSPKMKK